MPFSHVASIPVSSGLVNSLTPAAQPNPDKYTHTQSQSCVCVSKRGRRRLGWGDTLCIHIGNCCAFKWECALGRLKLFSKCTHKVNCSTMNSYIWRRGAQWKTVRLTIGLHRPYRNRQGRVEPAQWNAKHVTGILYKPSTVQRSKHRLFMWAHKHNA